AREHLRVEQVTTGPQQGVARFGCMAQIIANDQRGRVDARRHDAALKFFSGAADQRVLGGMWENWAEFHMIPWAGPLDETMIDSQLLDKRAFPAFVPVEEFSRSGT